MSDGHPQYAEGDIHFFERQEIELNDFEVEGFILDVGGGGEGIIGLLKGPQVVAIDPNKRELEEAAQGPLKIVMDARSLDFLDGAFGAATAFFCLMYLNAEDHAKVFAEALRVLEQGGRFHIWDAVLPPDPDTNTKLAAVPLTIKMPNGDEISTGYGTRWPGRLQDLEYYRHLAQDAGFEYVTGREEGQTLYLELAKP